MNYGWGDILRVDLTRNKVVKQPFPKGLGKLFVGGAGVNAKILYDEVKTIIDPFDPENRLIFGTGPLVGTIAPCANRVEVTSVGSLTFAFSDSSVGGYFGPELKWAGYEHVVFEGRAKKPVYVWIDDDDVELKDATHLSGKDVLETDEIIKEDLGDPEIHTAIAGPAGENLIRYAAPIFDLFRAAGWGGHGSIMGSKQLKAITVRGTKGVEIAKPGKKLLEACQKAREMMIKGPRTELLRWCGRIHNTEGLQILGASGVKNMQESLVPEEEFWKIESDTIVREVYDHESPNISCFNCPIACTHRFSVKEGPYAGTKGEKIEYTQVQDLKNMGIYDSRFLAKWTFETNRLGLDTSGPANAIAWAMECYERGILTDKDTEGLEVSFGDQEAALKILQMISERKGKLGDLLADGSALAAKKIGRGSKKYSMTVKGAKLDLDVRVAYGWTLSEAVSTRGADHLKGLSGVEFYSFDEDAKRKLGEKVYGHPTAADPTTPEGKAHLTRWTEAIAAVADALGVCKTQTAYLSLQMPSFEEFAEILSPITGMKFAADDLMKAGDRIIMLERAFNYKFGLTRDDDTLPDRFFEETATTPITRIQLIDKKVFERMKDDYYAIRGCDVKTGCPTKKKLEELGLDDVAKDVENRGTSLKRTGNRQDTCE